MGVNNLSPERLFQINIKISIKLIEIAQLIDILSNVTA
tara:strand:+ start:128 stop:241 length:114 start_codon:yes stop_codon:yes gene_type:complete